MKYGANLLQNLSIYIFGSVTLSFLNQSIAVYAVNAGPWVRLWVFTFDGLGRFWILLQALGGFGPLFWPGFSNTQREIHST